MKIWKKNKKTTKDVLNKIGVQDLHGPTTTEPDNDDDDIPWSSNYTAELCILIDLMLNAVDQNCGASAVTHRPMPAVYFWWCV